MFILLLMLGMYVNYFRSASGGGAQWAFLFLLGVELIANHCQKVDPIMSGKKDSIINYLFPRKLICIVDIVIVQYVLKVSLRLLDILSKRIEVQFIKVLLSSSHTERRNVTDYIMHQ